MTKTLFKTTCSTITALAFMQSLQAQSVSTTITGVNTTRGEGDDAHISITPGNGGRAQKFSYKCDKGNSAGKAANVKAAVEAGSNNRFKVTIGGTNLAPKLNDRRYARRR